MARMNDSLPSVTRGSGGSRPGGNARPSLPGTQVAARQGGSALNDSLPSVGRGGSMSAMGMGAGNTMDMMSSAARLMGGWTTGPANVPQPGAGAPIRIQNPFDLAGARGR